MHAFYLLHSIIEDVIFVSKTSLRQFRFNLLNADSKMNEEKLLFSNLKHLFFRKKKAPAGKCFLQTFSKKIPDKKHSW